MKNQITNYLTMRPLDYKEVSKGDFRNMCTCEIWLIRHKQYGNI